jgi:hypothetical protein
MCIEVTPGPCRASELPMRTEEGPVVGPRGVVGEARRVDAARQARAPVQNGIIAPWCDPWSRSAARSIVRPNVSRRPYSATLTRHRHDHKTFELAQDILNSIRHFKKHKKFQRAHARSTSSRKGSALCTANTANLEEEREAVRNGDSHLYRKPHGVVQCMRAYRKVGCRDASVSSVTIRGPSHEYWHT